MMSSFDSLPCELINKIFREAVFEHMDTSELAFTTRRSNTRILRNLSQVNRRWREVSIREGSLWASAIDVDHDSPAWLQKVIRHARTAPLVIHGRRLFDKSNWKYVLERVNSWGAFSVSASINPSIRDMQPLMHALTRPVPSLKAFQIDNLYKAHGNNPDDLDDKSFVLPDNLFSGHAPNLKKFRISCVYLRSSFNFSAWTTVTDLAVDQCLGGLQGDKILSRKWLDILRGMKQLQVLSLAWSYYIEYDVDLLGLAPEICPDRNIEDVADVHLSHLRQLKLTATIERNIMLDVFSRLVIPNACVTEVTVAHYFREPLAFDRLAIGLNRRVMGWGEAGTHFCISSLEKDIRKAEVGFRIKLNFVDLEYYHPVDTGYIFQFCYAGYNQAIEAYESDDATYKMMNIL